ncbi:MAG: flagellar hook-length control protein FliK [Pirellulales bacterium]|nr:flagellar hook-length control protein FliK [Pirellulales bacterium]
MNESSLDALFHILPVPKRLDPLSDSRDDDRSFDKHFTDASLDRRADNAPPFPHAPASSPSGRSEANPDNAKDPVPADRSHRTDASPNAGARANEDPRSDPGKNSNQDSSPGDASLQEEISTLVLHPACNEPAPSLDSPGASQASELTDKTLDSSDQANHADASRAPGIAGQSSRINDQSIDPMAPIQEPTRLPNASAEKQPIGAEEISRNMATATEALADLEPGDAIPEDVLAEHVHQDPSSHPAINAPVLEDGLETASDTMDLAANQTGDRGIQDHVLAHSLGPVSNATYEEDPSIRNSRKHQGSQTSGVTDTGHRQEQTVAGDLAATASQSLMPGSSIEAAFHRANESGEVVIPSSPQTSNDGPSQSPAQLQADHPAGAAHWMGRSFGFEISAERSKADTGFGRLRIDPDRFVARVARAFQLAEDRGGQIRLRLSPPDLGSVRIELAVKNGALWATIETETPAARHALLDHLPALRERLADQNIRIEQFDIDVRDETNGGQHGQTLDHFGYQSQFGTSKTTHRNSPIEGELGTVDRPRQITRPRGDEILDVMA